MQSVSKIGVIISKKAAADTVNMIRIEEGVLWKNSVEYSYIPHKFEKLREWHKVVVPLQFFFGAYGWLGNGWQQHYEM